MQWQQIPAPFGEHLPAVSPKPAIILYARAIAAAANFEYDHASNHVVKSEQAFIAMWFDKEMDDAFKQGLKAGVEQAGYTAHRIDMKPHNNKIDDEIIAEIRRSRFLVADFTHGTDGPRGGVYYEAGFAHVLGIPVIFTCHEDKLDEVHFDTRQYNHIVWKTHKDLREQLTHRICATIGDGPNRADGD